MVLEVRDRGIYCPAGDFWIDPWRPVERALITHAHSDHARPGHTHYLSTNHTDVMMQHRLGNISSETVPYNTSLQIGGAQVSFHPAGHVPGSAQIRVEVGGEVWVVSGDYKVTDDGLSEPFEPVPCHTFITECTFGLPIFTWPDAAQLKEEISTWWAACQSKGKIAILGAYSLGKAQRLMAMLDPDQGPILTHGAVEATNAVLRAQGIALPETVPATRETDRKAYPNAIVIAPPSALGSAWAKKFGPREEAFASGWMALRGIRRRRAAERGFVISDHTDWPGLLSAIKATGAEQIYVTHGYTSVFQRYLSEQGYDAKIVETSYEGETLESAPQE